jgi:hypothetical protein
MKEKNKSRTKSAVGSQLSLKGLTRTCIYMCTAHECQINKYLNFTGISLIILFIMSSCAHQYYIPKGPNVPLFTEKNDFRGSISTGSGNGYASADIQAAFAITDHFALISDYMISNGGNKFENNAKLRYFEGAVGYFKPFDRFMVFEVFGGFGKCSQEHAYYSTQFNPFPVSIFDGKSSLSYISTFLQPSLGATFKAFDVAFTAPFSSLGFEIEKNSLNSTSTYSDQLKLIDENRHVFLFDPAITIRGGWKYVKLQLQYVRSYNLTTQDLNFGKSKFSIGLYISISKKNKNVPR